MATPPYENITGIYTIDDKHQAISRADYSGSARPGQIVIDTADYSMWVGTNTGRLVAAGGGGGGGSVTPPAGANTQVQFNNAGAFGGSRQGIAEAETNRAFAQQGGQLAAQLRQQGFNTALGASQQDVANQMQAALANQGAGFQAANLGLNAAGQLGNLSQQGFNMGQSINQQQQQFGTMQQAINQALIDAARNQYAGFAGAPGQSLSYPLAAVGAANMGQQTQTAKNQPGLFNYLSLGLGAL
jgi:hypothetical protein